MRAQFAMAKQNFHSSVRIKRIRIHVLDIETIVSFSVASIALCLAPGPDNLFVLSQSATHGRSGGLWVVAGLCSGLLFHTSAVALGLAAIFQTSAVAFTVVKVVGVAYLLFLAWKAFLAKTQKLGIAKKASNGGFYLRGVVMNVTNPKVSIFFLAFLPQFVNPESGSLTMQIITLGLMFIVATIVVFGAIAFMGGAFKDFLVRSPKAQSIMNKASGLVLAGLAFRLAVTGIR